LSAPCSFARATVTGSATSSSSRERRTRRGSTSGVAAFENRNVTRIDELVQRIRDRQGDGSEIPDALGMYLLVDRAAGAILGISLFESERAIHAAEPIFERMGDEIPEHLRGRRLSVDVYEAPIHEVADGAAAARVRTFAGAPSKVEDGLRHAVQDVLPDARSIEGWKGIVMLVDRLTGAEKTMTLWESREALAASEAAADELRARAAEEAGQRIVSVERFEVPLAFDRAPRLITV
jgi:heme-degrading monooxygenase HmoA